MATQRRVEPSGSARRFAFARAPGELLIKTVEKYPQGVC
jgi:hypothetical protein